jgi:response regulator RpfG family c-di-GMP phosphodiesterase
MDSLILPDYPGRRGDLAIATMSHKTTEQPLASNTLRVLIVEDSADDAELLAYELRRGGFAPVCERVETAVDMKAALARESWDVVVSDHSVLQFDSLAALSVLKASGRDIPFISVSGTIGEERAVQAMKAGASDYLVKGSLARLVPVVGRELADAQERRARRAAEQALRDREQQTMLELAAAYERTLEGWARALDLRDRETEGHSRRVTHLTVRLARMMGISEAECVHIRRGAFLHDIGKMGIPDSILLKPAPLSPAEWVIMRRHPAYAKDLLAPIEYLRPALDIPYCHHEKWDGTGYPHGLSGEQIPLAARLFAAVDIWDAVRSGRPYRAPWSDQEARAYLASLAGAHLDPKVVTAFLELLASLDAANQPGARATDIGAPRAARKILVVDDHHANVELFREWLASDGYDVVTAGSGDAALAAVVQELPDLVLLDLTMPEPDGFTVCQRLKHAPATAQIPVILMSGLEPSAVQIGPGHLGSDDCLMKPIDAYELRVRVRRVLERVRTHDR